MGHAVQGKCFANTAATANDVDEWPDGRESNPKSQDGHHSHSSECVNRGLGRPMRCLRPFTSNATQIWASRLSVPARRNFGRPLQPANPQNSQTDGNERASISNPWSPRSPSFCTDDDKFRERRKRRRGRSICRRAIPQAARVRRHSPTDREEGVGASE